MNARLNMIFSAILYIVSSQSVSAMETALATSSGESEALLSPREREIVSFVRSIGTTLGKCSTVEERLKALDIILGTLHEYVKKASPETRRALLLKIVEVTDWITLLQAKSSSTLTAGNELATVNSHHTDSKKKKGSCTIL